MAAGKYRDRVIGDLMSGTYEFLTEGGMNF